MRAQESKRNTGASPQPPSGEPAPLNPRRAAEYVRAIRVYALRTLQKRIFHISPLTQYILDPFISKSFIGQDFVLRDMPRFQSMQPDALKDRIEKFLSAKLLDYRTRRG